MSFPRGLFHKYHVSRTDGTREEGADYFVLRLDTDAAARAVLLVYAQLVAAANPLLAHDLRERLFTHHSRESHEPA